MADENTGEESQSISPSMCIFCKPPKDSIKEADVEKISIEASIEVTEIHDDSILSSCCIDSDSEEDFGEGHKVLDVDRTEDISVIDDELEDEHNHNINFPDLDDSSEFPYMTKIYAVGLNDYTMCEVCFETKELDRRPCCSGPVCDDCLEEYIKTMINDGQIKIQCPTSSCSESMPREEISGRLDSSKKEQFYVLLVNANQIPGKKTCPRCNHVREENLDLIENNKKRKKHIKKYGYSVDCTECGLRWCFICHSPWHEGATCKEIQEGDILLKKWAKERKYENDMSLNAQKCPKCKVYISRSTGCDHMVCKKCNTEFCYKCGKRFIRVKFFGDHYSKLSILGCKYNFKPNNSAQRRFIRGSLFGATLLVSPVLAGLAVGAAAIVVAGGTIALPVYGCYKIRQRVKTIKRRKRFLQRRKEDAEARRRRYEAKDPYIAHLENMERLGVNTWRLYSQSSLKDLPVLDRPRIDIVLEEAGPSLVTHL